MKQNNLFAGDIWKIQRITEKTKTIKEFSKVLG